MIYKIISNFNKILRRILIGSYRQERISSEICKIIVEMKPKNNIRILDYGSGFFKPSLAKLIHENLKKEKIISNFICLDFYETTQLEALNTQEEIKYMNLKELDNFNYKCDFCVIADTLHHIGNGVENIDNLSKLLNKLKKNCEHFVIKDHFEYDLISRKLLQILDFFGNYQNKTNLPRRYFTRDLFNELINKSDLKIIKLVDGQKYYKWFFLFFNNPKFHFISLLKKNDK